MCDLLLWSVVEHRLWQLAFWFPMLIIWGREAFVAIGDLIWTAWPSIACALSCVLHINGESWHHSKWKSDAIPSCFATITYCHSGHIHFPPSEVSICWSYKLWFVNCGWVAHQDASGNLMSVPTSSVFGDWLTTCGGDLSEWWEWWIASSGNRVEPYQGVASVIWIRASGHIRSVPVTSELVICGGVVKYFGLPPFMVIAPVMWIIVSGHIMSALVTSIVVIIGWRWC